MGHKTKTTKGVKDHQPEEGKRAFMDWRGGREELLLHPVVVPHPDAARQHFQRRGKNFVRNLLFNNYKHLVVRGCKIDGSDIKQGGPIPKKWLNSGMVFRWEWDSGEDWVSGNEDDIYINVGKKGNE